MQNPHCSAWCSTNARCRSRELAVGPGEPLDGASVTRPSACTASIRHERTGSPSSCTVHAPQTPCSQPTCVPVSPAWWRMKSDSSVRGSTSPAYGAPLIVTVDLHRAAIRARAPASARPVRRPEQRPLVTAVAERAGAAAPTARPPARRCAGAAGRPRPRSAHRCSARPEQRDRAGASSPGATTTAAPATAKSPCVRACSTKAPPRPRQRRQHDLAQQLILARARSSSDPGRSRRAATVRSPPRGAQLKARIKRDQPPGNSAVGSAWATEPPTVPRVRIAAMADVPHRLREQRPARARRAPSARAWRGGSARRSAGSRARRSVTAPSSAEPVEVDEQLRACQPEVQHRHEALAAGQRLGLLRPGEQRQGVSQRARARRRRTGPASSPPPDPPQRHRGGRPGEQGIGRAERAAAAKAGRRRRGRRRRRPGRDTAGAAGAGAESAGSTAPAASARHSFSAVNGGSTWRPSASTTALATAGSVPTAPPSPAPLAPSGFSGDGVCTSPVSDRRDLCRGQQAVVEERGAAHLPVLIVDRLLDEAFPEPLYRPADHLSVGQQRVDHRASVVDGDQPEHVQLTGRAFDLDAAAYAPEEKT